MAYIDFTSAYRQDGPGAAVGIAPQPVLRRFSGLEWTVIALARKDDLASIGTPSRLSRALGGVFGLGTRSRLADRRLEALRQLSVRAWHQRGGVTGDDRHAFLEAGFSEHQLAALLESVARSSIDRARSIAA